MKHVKLFEQFVNENLQIIFDKPFNNTTIQGKAADGTFKGITVQGDYRKEWKKYSSIDIAIRNIEKNPGGRIINLMK